VDRRSADGAWTTGVTTMTDTATTVASATAGELFWNASARLVVVLVVEFQM